MASLLYHCIQSSFATVSFTYSRNVKTFLYTIYFCFQLRLKNLGLSDLMAIRDNQFSNTIKNITAEATANQPVYNDYGLDVATINELITLNASFQTLENAPRLGISVRASATALLKTKIPECRSLLEITDDLMNQFKSKEADFFQQYTTGRKIVNTGGSKTPPAPPPAP